MKKSQPKPRKQKKKRAKAVDTWRHHNGPGSGSIIASKVWGSIKRAQPGHKERTFSESMDRAYTLPQSGIFHPEYEAHDCLTV